MELVFGMGASFHLSYAVLKGNSGSLKIRVVLRVGESETVPSCGL